MFDIEKNIPIPSGSKGVSKYPIRDMEIGDSFFVPEPEASKRQSRRVRIYELAKRLSVKVTCRAVREPSVGLRVWRIA